MWLFAGLSLSILLQIPIVWAVTVATNFRLLDPRPETRRLLIGSAIIALAGVFAYEVASWLGGGFVTLLLGGILGPLIGLILGVVCFWLAVSLLLDHFFETHYDQSYMNTGQIVVISLLLWLIVGVIWPG